MIAFTTWIGENPNLPLDYVKNIQSWRNVGVFTQIKVYRWNDKEIQELAKQFPFLVSWRESHKYALCADFLRYAIPVYVLNNEITCYMDADVTLVQSINQLIERGEFVTAKEDNTNYGASILLSDKGHGFDARMVNMYVRRAEEIRKSFDAENPLDVLTAPKLLTEMINGLSQEARNSLYLIDDVSVFYPIFPWEEDGTQFTPNTRAIHWNDGAWIKNKVALKETEEEISSKFLKFLNSL